MAEWGVTQERDASARHFPLTDTGCDISSIACVMAHLSTRRVCDPKLTQDLLETYTGLQHKAAKRAALQHGTPVWRRLPREKGFLRRSEVGACELGAMGTGGNESRGPPTLVEVRRPVRRSKERDWFKPLQWARR